MTTVESVKDSDIVEDLFFYDLDKEKYYLSQILEKEKEILKSLKEKGSEPFSWNTELLSKRRYKRKKAKYLKKMNKSLNL